MRAKESSKRERESKGSTFFCPKISSDRRERKERSPSLLFTRLLLTFSRFILIVAERGDSGLWILGGGGGGRGLRQSSEEEAAAFRGLSGFGFFFFRSCCCCSPPPTKSLGASFRGLPLLRLNGSCSCCCRSCGGGKGAFSFGGGAAKRDGDRCCIFFFSLAGQGAPFGRRGVRSESGFFSSFSFFVPSLLPTRSPPHDMPLVLQAAARQSALASCSSSRSSAPILPARPRLTNRKLRRSLLLMPPVFVASAANSDPSPPPPPSSDWDRTAVVIVDHGSRRAEANAELEEFAALYR